MNMLDRLIVVNEYENMLWKLDGWVRGNHQHIIILGRPGVLKTTILEEHAAVHGVELPSLSTATYHGFLNVLEQHAGDDLVCFDDLTDAFFQKKDVISTCKKITARNRLIREVVHKTKDEERRIIVKSRYCFVVNQFEPRLPVGFDSFLSRCRAFLFNPTNKEVLYRANRLGIGSPVTNAFVARHLMLPEVKECSFDARILEDAAALHRDNDPDWENGTVQALGLPAVSKEVHDRTIDFQRLIDEHGNLKLPSKPLPDDSVDDGLDDDEDGHTLKIADFQVELTMAQLKFLSVVPNEWTPFITHGSYMEITGIKVKSRMINFLIDRDFVETKGEKGQRQVRRTHKGNQLVVEAS